MPALKAFLKYSPAPFNLIEAILIAPFEWILPASTYILINKVVMSTIFFVPLVFIAFFESQISHAKSAMVREYFSGPPPDDDGDPKIEDPSVDDDEGEISKISFEDLVSKFPNTAVTESAVILRELKLLREKVEGLERTIRESTPLPGKHDDQLVDTK